MGLQSVDMQSGFPGTIIQGTGQKGAGIISC